MQLQTTMFGAVFCFRTKAYETIFLVFKCIVNGGF